MPNMDPGVKAKWLEDLRSGNFRKGTNKLHKESKDDDGNVVHEFCCLGVLCEQAVAEGVIERRKVGGTGTLGYPRYVYIDPQDNPEIGSEVYPPKAVMDWAGLPSDNPNIAMDETADADIIRNEGCPTVSLATLNDEHYDEFGPIADKIEAQL
jgi:hypothetical protein